MLVMQRSFFNLPTAFSLVLCIAASAMWFRSYIQLDDISFAGPWHTHNFSSVRGRLFFQWGWSTHENDQNAVSGEYARGGFFWDTASSGATLVVEPMSRGWRLGGFDYFSWQANRVNAAGQPTVGEHVVIVPWWFLTGAFVILHIRWVIQTRRRVWRARVGRCLSCGYDLRATPDRCPECGTAYSICRN